MTPSDSCTAVIFDLDGTLIRTEAIYRRAFLAAARSCGLALPPGLYASLVGLSSPERVTRLRDALGSRFCAETFFATYYAHRRAMLPERLPVRRGAARLLRHLGRPTAIATSASRRTAEDHLARAGLAAHFPHVVTRDDVTRGKPAPEVFLLAAERLGVPPQRCIAVEDSVHGATAAHAAGMQTLLLARRRPKALEHVSCHLVQDFAALARHLAEPAPPPAARRQI